MGGVAGPAPRHPHIQGRRVQAGATTGDQVRGVHGQALGGVDGGGVPELDISGHIRGRDQDRPAGGAAGDRYRLDQQRPLRHHPRRVPRLVGVGLAWAGEDGVLDPVGEVEGVVVAAAGDHVAGAGGVPVPAQEDPGGVVDEAEVDELVADLRGDACGLGVGGGHDHGGVPVQAVGDRGEGGGGGGLVEGGVSGEAGVPVVLVQRSVGAVADGQGGGAFPVVGEAADLGQGVGLGVPVQQVHRSTGLDGAQLAGVTGQDQAGPRGVDPGPDRLQVLRGDHGRLVDHHDVGRTQHPLPLPPLRRAARCPARRPARGSVWCPAGGPVRRTVW